MTASLAQALTQAQAQLAVKPAVQPAAPVLIGVDALAAYLSPEQCDGIEEFAGLVLDKQIREDTFTAEARSIVGRVFASPCEWATWKPVIKAIKTELSPYAANAFRAAYKGIHGSLPTAGTGTGSGVKGSSPKKQANGLESRVADLVEYIAGINAKDVDAGALARVTKACAAMVEASAAFKIAVNE